ncbi:hypothetical protein J6590_085431, partial [Homalodisca vitripennis]
GALHPGKIVLLTDPLRRCGECGNYVEETKAKDCILCFQNQNTIDFLGSFASVNAPLSNM